MRHAIWPLAAALATVVGCNKTTTTATTTTTSPGVGRCTDDWTVIRGTQEADGASCVAFLGTAAEVNPEFDWWGAKFDQKAHPRGTSLKIEVKVSRPLEDADRPADLHFRGGYFGVAQDKYYFWDGDEEPPQARPNPHWTSWQQTKVDIHQETTLAVRQKGADLEGFINGALVGTFKLNAAPTAGPVGIGFKSAKGKAAKVRIRDFTVTQL